MVVRAMVPDQPEGRAVARAFAALMLVMGVAPIAAPVIGAQLLRVSTWHAVFVVLALVGAILFVATAHQLAETLPVERRSPAGRARRSVSSASFSATGASSRAPSRVPSPSPRCSPTSQRRRSCSRTCTACPRPASVPSSPETPQAHRAEPAEWTAGRTRRSPPAPADRGPHRHDRRRGPARVGPQRRAASRRGSGTAVPLGVVVATLTVAAAVTVALSPRAEERVPTAAGPR